MKDWMIALRAVLLFTLVTGILYPAAVTVIGKLTLGERASGSLLTKDGRTVGSKLIAQSFSTNAYFWPRPSAVKFDPASSGATNQSLASADLVKSVRSREAAGFTHEMRFASGSGLDPHISPEAARDQVQRVATARRLNPDQVKALELLVETKTEQRQFGFLGQPRVNVLSLNLSVDEHFGK